MSIEINIYYNVNSVYYSTGRYFTLNSYTNLSEKFLKATHRTHRKYIDKLTVFQSYYLIILVSLCCAYIAYKIILM